MFIIHSWAVNLKNAGQDVFFKGWDLRHCSIDVQASKKREEKPMSKSHCNTPLPRLWYELLTFLSKIWGFFNYSNSSFAR